MAQTLSSESELRLKFFDLLFEENYGFLCIATKNPKLPAGGFVQKFFNWPSDSLEIEEYIIRFHRSRDIYFCVNLLKNPERKKDQCKNTNLIWADLDGVDPVGVDPPPSIVIESSPGRYQGLWRLTLPLDPYIAENYSKRIAYKYQADKSGWDLTQLLRVPYTLNFKYNPPQRIKLLGAAEIKAPPALFELLPEVESEAGLIPSSDLPKDDELPPVSAIIYKYHMTLRSTNFSELYTQEDFPDNDWSRPLWRLIHTCLESGMSETETYAVVRESNCNKYIRDNRPATHLWRDVTKAKAGLDNLTIISTGFKPVTMPQICEDDYEPTNSFVTEYRTWAEEATDAVPQFHDLSAFMLLSSIVSNSVRLDTSYGVMVPNIWGMILGDSTLSRKTTAMRMVMDILMTINSEMVLATDASAEGLLSGLELRPNRTSLFFRDELSGFFDSINRKDYLSGMPEILTALYDVPAIYQRRLRKEIIRLENPIFLFFGGGVRDKVYEVSTEQYVTSGFLPRFLIVSGDTDMEKLRRTGPANDTGIQKRSTIVTRAADLYEKYATEQQISIGGQPMLMPPRVTCKLTPSAWSDYGAIEETMVSSASESALPSLALPTFERLSRSLLKMAMILAADRQDPSIVDEITVEEQDIKNASYYIQKWGIFSIDLIINTGKGIAEKSFDRVLKTIRNNPGVLKSIIMQHHHLSKREADEILSTLEDRMVIQRQKKGNGYAYWAV